MPIVGIVVEHEGKGKYSRIEFLSVLDIPALPVAGYLLCSDLFLQLETERAETVEKAAGRGLSKTGIGHPHQSSITTKSGWSDSHALSTKLFQCSEQEIPKCPQNETQGQQVL